MSAPLLPVLIDLTHTFAEPMPVFPGDPPPKLHPSGELEGCPMYEVTTGMHVGTHMDAPLHFLPAGANIAELAPDRFMGRGVLVDARGRTTIDADLLAGVHLQRGDVVLVLTGASAWFREPAYYRDYPPVSEAFAGALVSAGVHLLGLDTASPDRAPYAIHKMLLGGGVLIMENLANLEALLEVRDFEVMAFPVKFQAEAAPVRVLARVVAG